MKRIFLFVLPLLLPQLLSAQDLKRRSFLGVQLERLTADLMKVMNLPDTNGVLIGNVFPQSTAEAAGFRKGDVLLRIDNQPITEPQVAVSYVGSRQSNTPFTYELIRKGKKIQGKSVFRPYPEEHYADLDVIYTSAKTPAGEQRIILSKSKNISRGPVVYFIGGIGCYSLDAPFDTSRSEIQMLNRLAREGFVIARLEKPGIGDGAARSKACDDVSFMEEMEGYVRMIEQVKQRPEAGDKHYIIGHSMGGVMAPLIAEKTPMDGLIAYGTLGANFVEYLVKTRRTIAEAYDWSPEETDAYIKDCSECAVYYFAGKMSIAEAAAKKPACAEHLSVFELRSRSYNDELYALNLPEVWKKYEGRVLLSWGASDYIASREDHEILEKTVNRYHKGQASFVIIPSSDHGMNTAASFSEATGNPGPYNPEIGRVFSEWLKKQS